LRACLFIQQPADRLPDDLRHAALLIAGYRAQAVARRLVGLNMENATGISAHGLGSAFRKE
jgi:hypothetical protein